MSGITPNKTITAPSDYVDGTTGSNLKAQFNNNQATLHAGIQSVENALEDAMYEAFGSGVIDGMVATIGTGLSINITPGYALVGVVVDYAGGIVSVPANQAAGVLYFAQNGNFYTSPPSEVAYFQFCTYVSDASSVSALGVTKKILPCIVQTISDTFPGLTVDEAHTLDYEIDHSALIEFAIPGFITVSVLPDEVFSVEHINAEKDTGATFMVRITRNEEYWDDYESYAQCDLTFSRTGLAYR
jgi:hypothetical protein